MATPREVAEWMCNQLEEHGALVQADAVYQINSNFGSEFVYQHERGGLGIDKRVLREFRKLTEDTVVWDRWDKLWRKRVASDPAGKRRVE